MVVSWLLAGSLVVSGCAGTRASAPVVIDAPTASYHGVVLRPPIRLTGTDLQASFASTLGGRSTLASIQRGRLMLVYFGYTHCPDICPTTMADLGQALRSLSASVRNRVQVVFITSDPARDTVSVMNTWLANFDGGPMRRFVGLTASLHRIDTIARSVGVPLSPPVRHKNGTITVQHGAQTMAFVNGKAGLLWTAGTTPSQYAGDISRLFTAGAARHLVTDG